MYTSEQHAEKYLRTLFTSVVYEPDGNISPDFLADNYIAVEVRRLNQNEETTGVSRGLEETAIPTRRRIQKLLESLGPPTSNKSWFVFFSFRRPLAPWKELAPKIKNRLAEFQRNQTQTNRTIYNDGNFELDVHEASKVHPILYPRDHRRALEI
jgi:hypothetical protein